jgi:hypothetical protein
VKQSEFVRLDAYEIDRLVDHKSIGPSQRHPRVRERLAQEGIDLTVPILAWADCICSSYYYRNRKAGDPEFEEAAMDTPPNLPGPKKG